MKETGATNFGHLKAHDKQLVRLGVLAERYFSEDPNTCLLKLRQLTELLAQLAATSVGLFVSTEEKQADLLRRLQDQGIVPREVGRLFHEVRRAGNEASHRMADDHRTALLALRLTWQLGVWFHLAERVRRGRLWRGSRALDAVTIRSSGLGGGTRRPSQLRGSANQDPSDEPASALLARIAAQRDAPAGATSAPTPRRGHLPRTAQRSAVRAVTSAAQ